MFRDRLSVFALFIELLLAGATSVARAEPAHATFSIPDVWPWAYQSEVGEQKGSLIEVARRLSEISGVPIRADIRPVRRVMLEITSGDADFAFLLKNPEIDEQAVAVGKVIDINLLILAAADTDYPLDMNSLSGKRVAFITRSYLGEAFEYESDIIKVPLSTLAQGIELLMDGRISAIIASDHNFLRTLETREEEGYKLTFRQFRYEHYGDGISAMLYRSARGGLTPEAEKLAGALATLEESGELVEIFFGDEDFRAAVLNSAQ